MQVDPIKPTLKAPGTNRLKRKCDEVPSSFAFKLILRRYFMGVTDEAHDRQGLTLVQFSAQHKHCFVGNVSGVSCVS